MKNNNGILEAGFKILDKNRRKNLKIKKNKMECIIFIGIQASGKSTYYKQHFADSHLRINLDMLGRRSREKGIFEAAVKTKTRIVIDNTNIQIADREKYIKFLKENDYRIICYYFQIDLKKAIEANNKRIRKVPEEAIKKYYKNLVLPRPDEGFDEVYKIEQKVGITTDIQSTIYTKKRRMTYIGMVG